MQAAVGPCECCCSFDSEATVMSSGMTAGRISAVHSSTQLGFRTHALSRQNLHDLLALACMAAVAHSKLNTGMHTQAIN